jgi:hypothetical protein
MPAKIGGDFPFSASTSDLRRTLSADVRNRILSHSSGQERVDELFRLVQGRIIPRVAIETVARQKTP